jgi:hypothetical protein
MSPCESCDSCDKCPVTRGSNIHNVKPSSTVIDKRLIKERKEFFSNNKSVENKYRYMYCPESYKLWIERDVD